MEIVENGFCLCDRERENFFGTDVNHVVLVLQNAFDQPPLMSSSQSQLRGTNPRIDYAGGNRGVEFLALICAGHCPLYSMRIVRPNAPPKRNSKTYNALRPLPGVSKMVRKTRGCGAVW